MPKLFNSSTIILRKSERQYNRSSANRLRLLLCLILLSSFFTNITYPLNLLAESNSDSTNASISIEPSELSVASSEPLEIQENPNNDSQNTDSIANGNKQNLISDESVPDNSPIYSGNKYTNFVSNFDSSLAFDKSHLTYFYALNPEQSDNSPLAFYLTLALCALDKLSETESVSISQDALALEDDNFILSSDRKYPLDYLLYGLLAKQSDRAVISLARALSKNEADLLDMLNSKVELLKLNNTQFNYIHLMDPTHRDKIDEQYLISRNTQMSPYSVTSTPDDLAKIYRALSNKNIGKNILSAPEYSYYSQNILRLFTNPFSIIWSIYPDEIQSALSYEDEHNSSFICNMNFNNIDCIIILTRNNNGSNQPRTYAENIETIHSPNLISALSDDKKDAINEIASLYKSINNAWVNSKLFSNAEEYSETIKVSPFDIKLKFNSDIYYIHPKEINYVKNQDLTLLDDNIRLPIKNGDKLARLKITFANDQFIDIDLYAKGNYRIARGPFDELIPIYDKYKGLSILVIALIFVLIILTIYKILKFIYILMKKNTYK